MYGYATKSDADFSRGCAHPATRPRISATHPTSAEGSEPQPWGSGPKSITHRATVVGASA
jgi:hypothetical protein